MISGVGNWSTSSTSLTSTIWSVMPLKAQELTYMNGSTSWSTKFVKSESDNVITRQQAAALMKLGRELVMLMKMLLAVVLMLGVAALVVFMVKK